MKRIFTLILCVVLLSACNSRDIKHENSDQDSDETIQNSVSGSEEQAVQQAADTKQNEAPETEEETIMEDVVTQPVEEEKPDIDLTELSGTMVYSEVFNMLNEPDNYVNKKIKMRGVFGYYIDKEENNHFGCVIKDATACCAQGIEFVLTEELKYPDEYPELGSEITVVGDFDYYFDGNFINAVLYNAHFE